MWENQQKLQQQKGNTHTHTPTTIPTGAGTMTPAPAAEIPPQVAASKGTENDHAVPSTSNTDKDNELPSYDEVAKAVDQAPAPPTEELKKSKLPGIGGAPLPSPLDSKPLRAPRKQLEPL